MSRPSLLPTHMDVPKLDLASLKDKIASKLSVLEKGRKDKAKKGKKEAQNGDQGKKDASSEKKDGLNKGKKGLNPGSKDTKGPKSDAKDNKGRKPDLKANKDAKNGEQATEALAEDVLRREALALGASEADLALVEGLGDEESEQEFEDTSGAVDKAFGDDLSKFMKGIGLGKGSTVAVVEEESEVSEASEDEEEIEEEGAGQEGVSESENDVSENDQDLSEASDSEDSGSESDSGIRQAVLDKKKISSDADKITDFSSVNSNRLAIPNRTDWYNTPFPIISEPEKMDRFALERAFDKGKEALESDNKVYLEEFASKTSQRKFLSDILSAGTLNDKISALTLLIQEAPMHNLKALDTLLGYCEKKSRTAALQSINALKDLLLNGILPDRKLVAFAKQPLRKDLSAAQLAVFYFEDYLKKAYFKFVSVLEVLSHDPILHVKMNALSHIFDLLKAKPEQEANLLRLGVNKLGDVDNKVAAKASYQILQLEQEHPAMKQIVTEAVVDIVFKSSSEGHTQYYAVLALNQTILARREPEVANILVKTYFALFEKVLVETDPHNADKKDDKVLGKSENGRKNNRKNFKKGKKGGKSVKVDEKTESEIVQEKNSKLFSALLTGLNRAFPFSNLANDVYQKHLDTLFKITHSSNFNTSVQALVLVQHIISEQKLASDRYFRTLYESLLDPRLVTSSKQSIYMNLLFKSLKGDSANVPRVLAFVKRILQVSLHWLNVGVISGMIYLLIELNKVYPQIQDLTVEEASRPDKEDDEKTEDKNDGPYDGRQRDPRYAHAEKLSLWEVSQFVHHYHPTVAVYAASLLDGSEQPKPDLGLFTLAHFLDRFVYKNAKAKPSTKGSSIMQPLGGAHTGSLLVRSTNMDGEAPANTENWLHKRLEDVKPDEVFFHQYFTSKQSKLRVRKKGAENDGSDAEKGGLDDDEVWQALVDSRPDVEASDGEFSDLDADDFSDMSGTEEEDENEEEADFGSENELSAQEDVPEDDFDADEQQMFGINGEDEYDSDEVSIRVLDDEEPSKKRAKNDDEEPKKKKKKDNLPVFASVDDYAQYLGSDDEDFS